MSSVRFVGRYLWGLPGRLCGSNVENVTTVFSPSPFCCHRFHKTSTMDVMLCCLVFCCLTINFFSLLRILYWRFLYRPPFGSVSLVSELPAECYDFANMQSGVRKHV